MTAAADPAIAWDDLAQVAFRAQDIDRAVGFYRDVLGMPFLFQAPPGSPSSVAAT
jgi:catechol 2,3-dioxygenase-like lactoylglutathione lyase family enzyme